MQNDLGILWIVLIPRVVHRFSGACYGQRGDELQLKPFRMQEVGKRSMVVASWLEPNSS